MTTLQLRMRTRIGTSPADRKVLSMPQRAPRLDPLERSIEAGLAQLRAIRADKRSRKDIEWLAQVAAEVDEMIAWHGAGVRWGQVARAA